MAAASGKTILITGGAGFIGVALAERLLALGHRVHILDTYDTSLSDITFFRGSVLDQKVISQAMEGCDYVVHLAAVLGVNNAMRNPIECLDVNIVGTRNVLEAAVELKLKRMVFSSSSEVYGEPRETPIKEITTLAPKSEYGISKVVGEEYCRAFGRHMGLPYTIFRFFNVYGDKQRGDFVMSSFINAAVSGGELTVHGDGMQTRAFSYIDDIADGVVQGLFSEKAANEIVNIGNPDEPISMLDLAHRVAKIAGIPESRIRKIPFEQSDRTAERDVRKRYPDVSKAKALLGFSPKTSLDEGIRRVIAYKKAHAA